MKKRIFIVSALLSILFLSNIRAASTQDEMKINNIIKSLTLEEKVSFCYGSGMGFRGIPRLNIPEVGCTDGPRGPNAQAGTTAFPCGTLFGATWNPNIVEKAGKVMGEETRALHRGVLLGPGCNILRDPLGGRFFEYYTEDPYLNGKIASAHVRGVQSEGVAASIKHFACNNREENRNNYFSVIDDRTLNEIYLPAFKEVVENGVLTVMTAANGVNYNYVSDDRKLLTDILKNKWGFKGFVMTDWLGTRSTEKAAFAGLDVSMPGGDYCGFGKPLFDAVKQGRVSESEIDDKVRRVLYVYNELGLLDNAKLKDGAQLNTKAHQLTAQEIAKEGIVLLKNEKKALPLNKDKIKNILVTGPNANKPLCVLAMGGSSWVQSPYEITPLAGIKNIAGETKVTYISSDELGGFSLIPQSMLKSKDNTNDGGVNARYYKKGSDEPVVSKVVDNINYMWEMKSPDPAIKVAEFREARFDTWIYPTVDGKYTLKFIVGGGSALAYNNEWGGAPIAIIESNRDNGIETANIDMQKGIPYHLCLIYTKGQGDAAMRVEIETPQSEVGTKQLLELKKAAKKADAIIYVGGIDHSIDTEGRDRASLSFPKAQESLINTLAKFNKNINVVLVNGSPLELGGIMQNSHSIMEAWYPGMEGGNAIASVIFGETNPSGRLPFTWAKKLEDYPSHKLAFQDNMNVLYTDSLNVGYRYFNKHKDDVQFPFGYGLSYTTFDYSNFSVSKVGDKVNCNMTITNTGDYDGSEVVQIYVSPINPSINRPIHELKAFRKLFLKKGESQQLEIPLYDNAFSYYDVTIGDWKKDKCDYAIEVGTDSENIIQSKTISLK